MLLYLKFDLPSKRRLHTREERLLGPRVQFRIRSRRGFFLDARYTHISNFSPIPFLVWDMSGNDSNLLICYFCLLRAPLLKSDEVSDLINFCTCQTILKFSVFGTRRTYSARVLVKVSKNSNLGFIFLRLTTLRDRHKKTWSLIHGPQPKILTKKIEETDLVFTCFPLTVELSRFISFQSLTTFSLCSNGKIESSFS